MWLWVHHQSGSATNNTGVSTNYIPSHAKWNKLDFNDDYEYSADHDCAHDVSGIVANEYDPQRSPTPAAGVEGAGLIDVTKKLPIPIHELENLQPS